MSRKTLVPSAQYWFDAARNHQAKEGKMAEALMGMENAFNHTENALAYILDKVPGARAEFDRINKQNG